jgi:competence protein ComEC
LLTAVLAARGPPEELTQPSRLQGFAADVRGALRRAADRLPTDEAGLLPGLVVGDTSRLPAKLRADFQLTGLTHLTAVSGANLAIVVGAVLAGCRVGRVGPRLRAVVAGLALAGFVVVARPSPSVLRAAVMGLIAISGTVLGRRGNPLPALSGAVLALVLLDPGLARSIGFTLSVLATAGIVVWAPPWGSRLRRILPGSLAELVAIPAAAQLACAPVIAAAFGQVSLVAVPANLLAAIAVAPATLLGALAALAGSVLPPLAAPLVWLAAVPTGWLVLVAHGGAAIPGAAIGWPSGCVGGLLVVAAVIAGGAAIRLVRGDMLTLWPTSRRRSR